MTTRKPHADGVPQTAGNPSLPSDGQGAQGISDTFPATMEGAAAAAACLESFLNGTGCPHKVFAKLAIALDEIASNIINYSGAETFEMTASIPQEGDKVTLLLSDAGTPYDPLLHEDPDITQNSEQRQVGGLGIFMVKQIMDDVRYEFKDGKNCLYMEKKL